MTKWRSLIGWQDNTLMSYHAKVTIKNSSLFVAIFDKVSVSPSYITCIASYLGIMGTVDSNETTMRGFLIYRGQLIKSLDKNNLKT